MGSLWLAAAAIACRGHTSLCDPDCGSPEAGPAGSVAEGGAESPANGSRTTHGGAGYAGNEMSVGGDTNEAGATPQGDGGAPGTPVLGAGGASGCDDDADCRDASACNGAERCEARACVPGEPLHCDAGTTCDDDFPAEPCGFAKPSPWLLLYNHRRLWGLPTLEIGKRPLVDLGPYDDPTSNSAGLDTLYLSPDGRRALFGLTTFDLGRSILELSFGRGIPEPLHKIANIPAWGLYTAPYFFPESQGAVIQDSNTMSYWLDFSGERAVPSPLPFLQEEAELLQVCRDRRGFLPTPDSAELVYLDGGEWRETELGSGGKTLSPDRRLIFIAGDEARVVHCDSSAESASLGVTVTGWSWSGDSRHLFVRLPDATRKLYRVSPELTVSELWSGAVALGDWAWSSDRSKLLLRRSGDSPSYAYLDLSEASPVLHELGLPGIAQEPMCGGDGCLALIEEQPGAGSQLVFQPFDSARKLVPLASSPTPDWSMRSTDLERHRIVLERSTGEGERELRLLDFGQEPVSDRSICAWDAEENPWVLVASDDSGVVVGGIDQGWRWFSLIEADAPPVTLDVPAYVAWFQPWR
jgi:hypothetical protein